MAVIVTGISLIGAAPQSSSQTLSELLEGNKRFVSGAQVHPRSDAATRSSLAKGQKPKAVVVACSDSRVSPELLFDQGLGDLFVVRCAGNTVDAVAMGSIEYAVLELKAKLILVVGHEKCGAVKATIENHKLPGSIPAVVKPIRLAVSNAKHQKGDLLHNSIAQNVRNVVTKISSTDSVMRSALKSGVKVVGGVYDLESGKVEILQK